VSDTPHLWNLANEIRDQLVRWLESREKKQIYGKFKRLDMLRMTKMQVWAWRYGLEIEEILDLVVPYLRDTVTTKQKKKYGLGCSIASLTGEGSEKILVNALKQEYPEGEYRYIWRQREQERQLERERLEESDGLTVREREPRGILDFDDIQEYLQYSARRVERARRRWDLEYGAKRRSKKYRGNPWL
jgi:hypothetical protein